MSSSSEIEAISNAIKKMDVTPLFGVVDDCDLVNACVDFLMSKGYRIEKPFDFTYNRIKKIDDLINFFYAIHKKYHPDEHGAYTRKQVVDRATAKQFVNARMLANGISKEVALKECAEIIEAVFMFEDRFKFEIPVNFGFFGQDSMGWITEKAVGYLNKLRNEKLREALDDFYDLTDDLEIGYSNLGALIKEFEKE